MAAVGRSPLSAVARQAINYNTCKVSIICSSGTRSLANSLDSGLNASRTGVAGLRYGSEPLSLGQLWNSWLRA
jgi:hypothetical protein